jgi:hypothetical protein
LDGFDADEEDEEVESDKEMGLDDEDGDGANTFNPQSFAEVCTMILTYGLYLQYILVSCSPFYLRLTFSKRK